MEKFVEKQQKMIEETSRRHIFDAVVRVTQRDNKTDFTMQHIADEAGMAIGTLYNYFKNKNDLLIYVFQELIVMNKKRCYTALSGSGNPVERLQKYITEFLQFGRENIIIFRIFDRSGLRDHLPEGDREKNTMQDVEMIKKVLEEGIQDNIFHKMDTTIMAKILFASMIGLSLTEPLLNEFTPEQLSQKLMHLID